MFYSGFHFFHWGNICFRILFELFMFMLWCAFINSEDLYSAPSSSIRMGATFLSLSFNMLINFFRISRGGSLLLDWNTKKCEVEEHTSTKVEVKPSMISTLKNEKSIWITKPGEKFDTTMLLPMVILFDLFNIQTVQGYSKSDKLFGRTFMIPFFSIFCNLEMEILIKRLWKSW